jgi:hypothetical protein
MQPEGIDVVQNGVVEEDGFWNYGPERQLRCREAADKHGRPENPPTSYGCVLRRMPAPHNLLGETAACVVKVGAAA